MWHIQAETEKLEILENCPKCIAKQNKRQAARDAYSPRTTYRVVSYSQNILVLGFVFG